MVLDYGTTVQSGRRHDAFQNARCTERTRDRGGHAGIGRGAPMQREDSLTNDIFLWKQTLLQPQSLSAQELK